MSTFEEWVTTKNHVDKDLRDLGQYIQSTDDINSEFGSLVNGKSYIQSTIEDEQKQDRYVKALERAWRLYETYQVPENEKANSNIAEQRVRSKFLTYLSENFLPISILFVLFVVLAIFYFVFDAKTLKFIASKETSRGIITIFFGLGTMSVAIILTLFSIMSTGSADELQRRFDMGKQVLTTLIGVFGTIIGFYFGTEAVNPSNPGVVPDIEFVGEQTDPVEGEQEAVTEIESVE